MRERGCCYCEYKRTCPNAYTDTARQCDNYSHEPVVKVEIVIDTDDDDVI